MSYTLEITNYHFPWGLESIFFEVLSIYIWHLFQSKLRESNTPELNLGWNDSCGGSTCLGIPCRKHWRWCTKLFHLQNLCFNALANCDPWNTLQLLEWAKLVNFHMYLWGSMGKGWKSKSSKTPCQQSVKSALLANYWMLMSGFEVSRADRPMYKPTNGKGITFIISWITIMSDSTFVIDSIGVATSLMFLWYSVSAATL